MTTTAGVRIHPTAVVDGGAEIDADVEVGPYAVIGAGVEIASGCRIGPHAVIAGGTRIGANTRVWQFVSLGDAPQDKKYSGEPTRLEIGENNTIREFCTINRGTAQDAGVTRIGNDNWIMAYVHIAHDCRIGSRTIFANNAQVAGHVRVDDDAVLGGFTVVHQFCRIGAHAITGMGTIVLQDIPPYVKAWGNTARPYGINSKGLTRRGYPAATISALKRAYRVLYRAGLSLDEARARLDEQRAECPEVGPLVDFIAVPWRGIIR
jgi:UDP-N-acetylglucosamine acyltransferase